MLTPWIFVVLLVGGMVAGKRAAKVFLLELEFKRPDFFRSIGSPRMVDIYSNERDGKLRLRFFYFVLSGVAILRLQGRMRWLGLLLWLATIAMMVGALGLLLGVFAHLATML